ncbi:DUF3493 domain-containing protein [Geminocystis sp. GBBB08]|uniref:DUF3493 domain-containing protein n=1 Tax=Geminocystis sp. GBBB08 TaxID=2604140 RepID=UPI0027E28B86|nr:DUF3493 domain-containing protein [Geminocystis sp. GBBB08]
MNNNFKNIQNNNNKNNLDQEKYAYLKAEAEAPYKGLRKFIYFGIGASGAIGAFIFFIQIIAGKNVTNNIPNLLIQLGVITLMILLFRWENRQNT